MKDRGRVLRDADLEFLCLAYREGAGAVCLKRLAGVLGRVGPVEGVVAACVRTKTYGVVVNSLESGVRSLEGEGGRIRNEELGIRNERKNEGLSSSRPRTPDSRLSPSSSGLPTSGSRLPSLLRREVLRRWVPQRERIERVRGVVREISAGTGLGFAFLRGAALERYYLHPEARVCEDVDVLVPEADHAHWEEALLEAGFKYRETEAVREARRIYIGQTEFVHEATGVLLDLQYRLTGNGGIGPVAQDMEGVWGRALRNADCGLPSLNSRLQTPVRPAQQRRTQNSELKTHFVLSREDLLLEVVRHFGHGHDFTRGFLRACLDVQKLLKASPLPIHPPSLLPPPSLDWDLVAREAERCECLCVLDFFGHAYNTLYAMPEDGEPLVPSFRHLTGITTREAAAFAAAILRPHLRVEADPAHTGPGLVQANRMCLGIAWALDRPRRFLSLLRLSLWPHGAAFILLTRDWPDASTVMKRLRLAAQTLAATPGILTGGFLRVALCGVRFLMKHTRG